MPLLRGYQARAGLTQDELRLIPDLILARQYASLAISAWRAARYPWNADYILRNAPGARRGLAALAALGPGRLADALLTTAERPRP